MSLGIILKWRALPLCLGLWVPRELPSTTFITRLRPAFTTGSPLRATTTKTLRLAHHLTADKESEIPGNDLEHSKTQKKQSASAEMEEVQLDLERSILARSILVKSPRAYPSTYEEHESLRRHYKSVSAQVYHERNRKSIGVPQTDWRKVLEMMAQATPVESPLWIEDGLRIDVPKEVLELVLDESAGDDKIGSIRRRTGAAFKISREESTLLVSGTRQAIDRATTEFRSLAGKITITRLYSPLGPGQPKTEAFDPDKVFGLDSGPAPGFFEPPLSREESAHARRHKIRSHVYSIPLPTSWTPKNLEDYVAALIDAAVVSHLHTPLYGASPSPLAPDHERAVARCLKQVLMDAPVRLCASSSAFKLALGYLCGKGDKYLPEARQLFVIMDQRGLKMDTDVFNQLLRSPVQTRNLRKFQQTIRNMTGRSHAPNLDTWLLFLRMTESLQVRSHILQTMHAKNLLGTPEAICSIAREMATHDAEHAVRAGKDLSTFLKEQEERYGSSWLRLEAGVRVLHVLSAHGRYADAFTLLDKMSEHHQNIPKALHQERLATRPNVKAFNAILQRAKTQRTKMQVAVNLLCRMKKTQHPHAVEPNSRTLHLLFEMAWKLRHPATVAAIWRYASLARLTTSRMRTRVAALLAARVRERVDVAGGKNSSHSNIHDNYAYLTPAAYRELGGEALARQLAGGGKALAALRAAAAVPGRRRIASPRSRPGPSRSRSRVMAPRWRWAGCWRKRCWWICGACGRSGRGDWRRCWRRPGSSRWFFGDGGGAWRKRGLTWRSAIDGARRNH